jgi:RNA polymerase sigma-70 factor, ECF subfamily
MWNLRGDRMDSRSETTHRPENSGNQPEIMHCSIAARRNAVPTAERNDIIHSACNDASQALHNSTTSPLATEQELSDFLKSVEKRAFKRTAYTVRDDDAALDIVQDSMIRLAENYGDRPPAELPLVFARILSNATMDWFRRLKVRNSVLVNLSEFEGADSEDDDFNLLELLDTQGRGGTESSADSAGRLQMLALIDSEVQKLPTRQREAFLLRYWEELDVAETASVMGCSEGSVKTHCSRAVHALAKALRAKGITSP